MSFDAELDRLYAPSQWSPRGKKCMPVFVDRITKYSENFQKSHADWVKTIRYGEGVQQIMDVVRKPETGEDPPIVLFIHGGYWVETSRAMYLYVAEQVASKGYTGVVVGYDQAPKVSLTAIVNEIREAYIFLSKKFPKCKELTVTGHSAGGHLSSMLLATNWGTLCPQETCLLPIKRCVPVSGVPDIRPMVHTEYGPDLNLTKKELLSLSPLLQIESAVETCKRFGTKVISVVGEHDSPAFKEKSKEYAELLAKESVDSEFVVFPGLDHFEMFEKLTEPDYKLNKYLMGAG